VFVLCKFARKNIFVKMNNFRIMNGMTGGAVTGLVVAQSVM
jgi:hypothetical protein